MNLKRYKLIIELEENRKTCVHCPLCDHDSNCILQSNSEEFDTWCQQLKLCPLE